MMRSLTLLNLPKTCELTTESVVNMVVIMRGLR